MAVSVLGRRAVAGPSVLIEAPGTVTDLTARRVDGGGLLEVSFRWPEPCVLIVLRLEQDGVRWERRVARSRYLSGGLRIPAGPTACRVTVTPLPRPDASVAVAGTAEIAVPEASPPSPEPEPPADSPGSEAARPASWWCRWRPRLRTGGAGRSRGYA
jgi:hypothetical protein